MKSYVSKLHLTAVAVILTIALSASAEDNAPVLFQVHPVTKATQVFDVELKKGLHITPLVGKKYPVWRITPGNPLSSPVNPPPRAITLYQKTDSGDGTLGAVLVKYYKNRLGTWTPHFQFSQEILFKRAPGGGWQPKQSVGIPEFIEVRGPTMPNGEGYYPALELRPLAGPISIDAWQIIQ